MANWIRQRMRFTGSAEALESLKKVILSNEEYLKKVEERNEGLADEYKLEPNTIGKIDFNVLIMPPTDIFMGNITSDGRTNETEWFGWRCKNWGCRWNVSEDISAQTEDMLTDDTWQIDFDTAWDLPTKWWDKVAEKCIELGISAEGEYADEDFGGMHGDFILDESGMCYAGDNDNAYYELWGDDDEDFEENFDDAEYE